MQFMKSEWIGKVSYGQGLFHVAIPQNRNAQPILAMGTELHSQMCLCLYL